jgi:ceramide glucosyltransferase
MATALSWTGHALTLLATLYALLALACRARSYHAAVAGQAGVVPACPPITVFKPLCGIEPRLEANIATFCEQSAPAYQLVFGVRDRHDPAIAVVDRIRARYPDLDIELIVDARVHGSNFKVSNLINMAGAARHPWLVIADSDIAVGPDYLEKVCVPLADPAVGIVTCLYRGRPLGNFWTRLGALFINTWFVPSVRVASAFGDTAFGFGATIAMRAETLAAVGGFHAVRNRLADDFWLGQLSRERGLATVISGVCVTTDVSEADFRSTWQRERRWMQTIRGINPLGYAFTFVTFTFPVLAAGVCLAPTQWNGICALLGAAARLGYHLRQPARGMTGPAYAVHAPLRDCLTLLAWLGAYTGTTTRWRNQTVPVFTPPEHGIAPGKPIRKPQSQAGDMAENQLNHNVYGGPE